MEERRPKTGERYRHFKDRWYQIVGIATHSETGEEMVVYQALYGEYGLYVRPLSMFVSEVDHEKYPLVTQKYRFERADEFPERARPVQENKKEEEEEEPAALPEKLMAFLESESNSEKLHILQEMRKGITPQMLETMALSIDAQVDTQNIEEGLSQLEKTLMTHIRYEGRT